MHAHEPGALVVERPRGLPTAWRCATWPWMSIDQDVVGVRDGQRHQAGQRERQRQVEGGVARQAQRARRSAGIRSGGRRARRRRSPRRRRRRLERRCSASHSSQAIRSSRSVATGTRGASASTPSSSAASARWRPEPLPARARRRRSNMSATPGRPKALSAPLGGQRPPGSVGTTCQFEAQLCARSRRARAQRGGDVVGHQAHASRNARGPRGRSAAATRRRSRSRRAPGSPASRTAVRTTPVAAGVDRRRRRVGRQALDRPAHLVADGRRGRRASSRSAAPARARAAARGARGRRRCPSRSGRRRPTGRRAAAPRFEVVDQRLRDVGAEILRPQLVVVDHRAGVAGADRPIRRAPASRAPSPGRSPARAARRARRPARPRRPGAACGSGRAAWSSAATSASGGEGRNRRVIVISDPPACPSTATPDGASR